MPTHRETGIALYNQGDYEDATRAFVDAINERIKQGGQPSLDDANHAGAARYAVRDFKGAAEFLNLARKIDPDNIMVTRNLAQIKKKLGVLEEAVELSLECLKIDENDSIALDILGDTYHRLGELEQAKAIGRRSLEVKDLTVCKNRVLLDVEESARDSWSLNPVVDALDLQASQNVISYSLWGSNAMYCDGAVANARIAPILFPQWRCRFYCDDSVPAPITKALLQAGAEVVKPSKNLSSYYGLFWRFGVIDDLAVDRFLIRDADSPLTPVERAAVDEWVESDQPFHLIRDWYSHTELILAGLWGGVQGVLPKLEPVYDRYVKRVDNERTVDQRFLREYVWPLIRDSHLAHDSYFEFYGASRLPVFSGDAGEGHVGQAWPAVLGQWRQRTGADQAE